MSNTPFNSVTPPSKLYPTYLCGRGGKGARTEFYNDKRLAYSSTRFSNFNEYIISLWPNRFGFERLPSIKVGRKGRSHHVFWRTTFQNTLRICIIYFVFTLFFNTILFLILYFIFSTILFLQLYSLFHSLTTHPTVITVPGSLTFPIFSNHCLSKYWD